MSGPARPPRFSTGFTRFWVYCSLYSFQELQQLSGLVHEPVLQDQAVVVVREIPASVEGLRVERVSRV